MPNYNQNSGYGQALLNAVKANVPSFGNVFVVFNSSDTDEGNYQRAQEVFKPDVNGRIRFYTDLSAAEDAAESNNNDVIVLDNNGSHTLTTFITNDKNRLHYIGLDYLLGMNKIQGQGAKVNIGGTTATNTSTMRHTGVRGSFRGIKFTNSNTDTASLWAFEDGGEFTYIDSCAFVKSGLVTTTTAADFLLNGDSTMIKNSEFGFSSQAITANGNRPCIDMGREQITGKVARDTIIDDCVFLRRANDSDNSFIYGSGATDVERMCLVRNPVFWQDALATANMDECVSFGAAQTNGVVGITGAVLATGTPASISTTTGVFIAQGSMDGTNPEAKIGIAIQAT